MADHPIKVIRDALRYAEKCGWIVKKAGSRSHAWGIMRCSHGHSDCRMSIWSTPRSPENHARAIRRKVNRCPGAAGS